MLLPAAGGAYGPLATYPCPSLEPFPSLRRGAHRPLPPLPLSAWPILTSPHPLPFPWEVLPTEPQDCPCFTALCRVHTEGGGGGVLRYPNIYNDPHNALVILSCVLCGFFLKKSSSGPLCSAGGESSIVVRPASLDVLVAFPSPPLPLLPGAQTPPPPLPGGTTSRHSSIGHDEPHALDQTTPAISRATSCPPPRTPDHTLRTAQCNDTIGHRRGLQGIPAARSTPTGRIPNLQSPRATSASAQGLHTSRPRRSPGPKHHRPLPRPHRTAPAPYVGDAVLKYLHLHALSQRMGERQLELHVAVFQIEMVQPDRSWALKAEKQSLGPRQ